MNRLRPATLRAAIDADALTLHYQAQVHVPSGRLAGVEGFVRWPHPSHGLLGPGEIVPLVEEGLLHSVFDRWVVTELCRQAAAWRRASVLVPIVSANVWPQSLRHPAFAAMVGDALAASGAEPTMLEIQLPRGALDDRAVAAALGELRTLGVRLASEDADRADEQDTLARIHTLVVPRGAGPNVLRRAVDLGRRGSARVVAEGIETAEQRDAVLTAGCEIVQGYVNGPEVSASDVRLQV